MSYPNFFLVAAHADGVADTEDTSGMSVVGVDATDLVVVGTFRSGLVRKGGADPLPFPVDDHGCGVDEVFVLMRCVTSDTDWEGVWKRWMMMMMMMMWDGCLCEKMRRDNNIMYYYYYVMVAATACGYRLDLVRDEMPA